MEYLVKQSAKINLFVDSVEDEILQNVATILATRKGEASLDINLGLTLNFIDAPTTRALTLLKMEIVEAIKEKEPRFEVTSIDFKEKEDGVLIPTVKGVIISELR